jgi:Lipase maturation factor
VSRPPAATPSYWLTRFVLLRLLGLVYATAFLVWCQQSPALLGSHGILPVDQFLARVVQATGSRWDGFRELPSLFWLDASDRALAAAGITGLVLSLALLAGFANALTLAVLWALYLSIVHVGQLWYGYGWEIQLAETGFLAIFFCPLLDPRPFPRRPPPTVVVWLYRWLAFRIMLGAGLIKLRGDSCWRDLTCLDFHYETQPIPNPFSRAFHLAPRWTHRAGTAFNHLCEVALPWLVFWPRAARHVAGVLLLVFQGVLIASGNLAFLNWLTIVPVIACFDDGLLAHLLPRPLVTAAERAAASAEPSRPQQVAVTALAIVVALLSVAPVRNLLSPHQFMNTSFDRLDLVNTYGAFGSVGRERDEIVFEGTADPAPDETSSWREYEFPCKPGDPMRRPCLVSPYHYRLDWQIWFAAMATPDRYPWTVDFAWKLLHGDLGVLGLLANNPFPEKPPRYVRALLYRYEFTPAGDPSGAWWRRTRLGIWLPALSTDDARLELFLRRHGFTP